MMLASRTTNRVLFLVSLLLLDIGLGVTSAKVRSWRKHPQMSQWTVDNPGGRYGMSIVTTSEGAMWMFGGIRDIDRKASDALIKIDVETKEWTEITTAGTHPIARYDHGMVSVGTNIFVYGGVDRATGDKFTEMLERTRETVLSGDT